MLVLVSWQRAMLAESMCITFFIHTCWLLEPFQVLPSGLATSEAATQVYTYQGLPYTKPGLGV